MSSVLFNFETARKNVNVITTPVFLHLMLTTNYNCTNLEQEKPDFEILKRDAILLLHAVWVAINTSNLWWYSFFLFALKKIFFLHALKWLLFPYTKQINENTKAHIPKSCIIRFVQYWYRAIFILVTLYLESLTF